MTTKIRSLSFYFAGILKNYIASYRGLSTSVWQGIIISFVEATLVGICYFLSIYFVNDLKISVENAGLLLTCYGLGTIVGALISGKLCDYFSPGIISIISLLLQSLGYFALTLTNSFSFLATYLFIIGIGAYGFITSNHVWVLARCKNEQARLKAINLLNVASNIGLGISAIIISLLSIYGFFIVFKLSSLFLLLTSIFLIIQETRESNFRKIIYSTDVISNIQQHAHVVEAKVKEYINYYVLGCLFVVGMIISQINSTYPLYLQTSFPEMGVKSFGFLFTLNTFMVIAFQTAVVEMFSHRNKIFMIGISSFLIGIGMTLLNLSYFFIFALLACIIYSLGEILFFPISQFLYYEGSKNKGHSLGMYRMVYAVSRVAGPTLGGVIYQQLGGHILWYVCGILGFVCFVSPLFFKSSINHFLKY